MLEQLVRPVDQRAQGLLPLLQDARAAGQQLVAVVEPRVDVGHGRASARARRRARAPAGCLRGAPQLGHRRRLALVEGEAGLCSLRRGRRTAAPRSSARAPRRSSPRRGTGSGRTGKRCSPGTRSGSRLVARMRTCGAAEDGVGESADGLSRCSQLSSTSSTRCVLRCAHRVSSSGRSGSSRTPSTCAVSLRPAPGRGCGASSTNQTPSGTRAIASAAACSESRVLPSPPVPSSVSSRGLREQALDLGELALAADERRHLLRQVVRNLADRQPPVAHADDAVAPFRRRPARERRLGVAHLEQLDRVGHALELPVPVRDDLVGSPPSASRAAAKAASGRRGRAP